MLYIIVAPAQSC